MVLDSVETIHCTSDSESRKVTATSFYPNSGPAVRQYLRGTGLLVEVTSSRSGGTFPCTNTQNFHSACGNSNNSEAWRLRSGAVVGNTRIPRAGCERADCALNREGCLSHAHNDHCMIAHTPLHTKYNQPTRTHTMRVPFLGPGSS